MGAGGESRMLAGKARKIYEGRWAEGDARIERSDILRGGEV